VDAGVDAADADTCPDGWLECQLSARQPLTIDYSGGVEDLVDVPVLVVLDGARADLSFLTRNSLRFFDDAGQQLAHEAEDDNGTISAWVKLPVLTAGTTAVVTAYYGNDGIATGEQATEVWSNGYSGVWHLSEDPAGTAPQLRDQSVNENHGSTQGAIPSGSRVAGQVGSATAFDGATQWIEVPHSTSLDFTSNTATLSAWFRMTDLQSEDMGLVVKSAQPDPDTMVDYNYQLAIEYTLNVDVVENAGNFRVRTDDLVDSIARVDTETLVVPDTWYYVVGVYDGTEARIYLNGGLEATELQVGSILTTTEPLVMGRRALGDERFFNGAIDEVRATEQARSAGWIGFQYRSMTDQVVSYGAVEHQ